MSYQDKIYNQNGKVSRNSTVPVVNTSSDVCVFTNPLFTMSGGSKIECVDIQCDISGVSFNDIFTATTECFYDNQLSGTCFSNVEWATRVYEDDDLVYHNNFYTSSTLTGGTPTFSGFNESVSAAFDALGYDYELSGTVYTLSQIYGVNNLKVVINTDLNYQDNCPIISMSGLTFTGTCEDINSVVCDEYFNGLVIGDHNVFPITNQSSIDLDFIFTGNTDTFIDTNAVFKFEIYKFNNVFGFFNQPPVYRSLPYEWSTFSGESAFTETISVDSLDIDGDYLVKGFYVYDNCTEFGNLLGITYSTEGNKLGDKYQLYKTDRDFYFVSFYNAQIPSLEPGEESQNEFGSLNVNSSILNGGTDVFSYPAHKGDLIVNLNGITLSKEFDYTFEDIGANGKNVLKLSGQTYSGDVLTYIYTNSTAPKNNLKQDIIDINSPISEGPMDGQGGNAIYLNTTTGKYELYTELVPVAVNDVVVTLNGMSLANNVDYYLSTSNPKRIILEGDILLGDILNIWYNTNAQVQGNIFTSSVRVDWALNKAPQNSNGKFTLELSTDINFNNIVNSVEVDYVKSQIGYSTVLGLVGGFGDKLFYRVKNEKYFIDICGGRITSTAFSEIIDITLQTNSIKTY